MEEHRLALVLNGGISLAVWMGGVAHEIDVVRQVSRGTPLEADPAGEHPVEQQAVFDRWTQLCAGGPRLTVDVISGTSAGGLNGVFLAAAIARGGSLQHLRALWLQEAQLDAAHLLSPQAATTDPPPRDGTVNAVLDGRFFHDAIVRTLAATAPQERAAGNVEAAPQERAPHPVGSRVSLITTASAIDGPPRRYVDSDGTEFTVDDHRRRFAFDHGREALTYRPSASADDFDPGDPSADFADGRPLDAIAWAARATASIPAVFDPVEETADLRRRRAYPPASDPTPREWLVDGGLLDNAPFDAVLDAVARQPLDGPWRRTVGYVVPSAEAVTTAEHGPALQPGPPPWASTVLKLITYPGESNLRSGISRLDAMLASARPDLDTARLATLLAGGQQAIAAMVGAAGVLLPQYRAARAVAGIGEVQVLASGGLKRVLAPQRDIDVAAVALAGPSWLPATTAFVPGQRWVWGLAAADRTVRLYLRSLSADDAPDANAARSVLHDCTERIRAVRDAVTAHLGPVAERTPADDLSALIERVYTELWVPEALGRIVSDAAAEFAGVRRTTAGAVLDVALSLEVVDGASGLPVEYHPTPAFDFRRFDVQPSGVFAVPATARSTDLLFGSRLGHFAAFGREEWRRWDYLWGRVTAAAHLCALLGVPQTEVQGLADLIAAAEGYSPEQVRATITTLLDERSFTTETMFGMMRGDGIIAAAADAALHLGGTPAATDPLLPGAVRVAGSLLATALARDAAAQFSNPPPAATSPQQPGRLARLRARILACITKRLVASGPHPVVRRIAGALRTQLWKLLTGPGPGNGPPSA